MQVWRQEHAEDYNTYIRAGESSPQWSLVRGDTWLAALHRPQHEQLQNGSQSTPVALNILLLHTPGRTAKARTHLTQAEGGEGDKDMGMQPYRCEGPPHRRMNLLCELHLPWCSDT